MALYDEGTQSPYTDAGGSVLEAFRSSVDRTPAGVAIYYFDGSLDYRTVDDLSDAFACWLHDSGVTRDDRVFIALQNVPQFAIGVLGTWKLGAIPVLGNPMYRAPELGRLFDDCTPKVMLCHKEHYPEMRIAAGGDATIITTSPDKFQSRNDRRVLPNAVTARLDAADLLSELTERVGERPASVSVQESDIGLLLYTSGTTGKPKGAKLTHKNLAYTARLSQNWFKLGNESRILAIAPLFHITGFELHFCLSIICATPLILFFRFDPSVALEAARQYRPSFTIGASTAFIAMMNVPAGGQQDLASLRHIFSGGAPVSPALVAAFSRAMGHQIRTAYGMTETTAPTHAAPLTGEVPVDPSSGAMAIGLPLPNVEARIVDPCGVSCAVGEAGEICVRGPQVMAGYWNRPEETAQVLHDGWMRTGDVGFMDTEGWFYLIDRKKDMIIASGFKVWPREVEDALYSHPAVREVAVVGIADAYRGETVKAFVSLKDAHTSSPEELMHFCRERLAAYKCPRTVEIIGDLPKTASGKIMRHALRDGTSN